MTTQTGDGYPYSDESPFVRLLDTPGSVRMLDAFLRRYGVPISASEMEEFAGVSKSSFSRNKDVLLELGVIERAHTEGQRQYYRLNTESDIVETLGQFHTKLLRHEDRVRDNTTMSTEEYIGRLATTRPDGDADAADHAKTGAEITEQLREEMIPRA